MPNSTLSLFIVHEPNDIAYCEKMLSHLAVFERTEKINITHSGQMVAGTDTEVAILEKVAQADLILLLISADFIESDFCYERILPLALQRNQNYEAVVIAIVIRQCFWEDTPLKTLQVLPKNGIAPENSHVWQHADVGYAQIIRDLHQTIKEELHTKGLSSNTDSFPQPPPSSPYKQGKVLYLIPDKMQLEKKHKCYIRIAPEDIAESVLKERLKDANTAVIEQLRIGNIMKSELIDDSGDDAFEIELLSELEQPIEEYGYTEWRYHVTPIKQGNFALCIKIAVLIVTKIGEKDKEIYKSVVVLERDVLVATQIADNNTDWRAANEVVPINSEKISSAAGIETVTNNNNQGDEPDNETVITMPDKHTNHESKPVNNEPLQRPALGRRIITLLFTGVLMIPLLLIVYNYSFNLEKSSTTPYIVYPIEKNKILVDTAQIQLPILDTLQLEQDSLAIKVDTLKLKQDSVVIKKVGK